VTVALSGDGGDENFAGYERYAANKISSILDKIIPPFVIKALLPSVMKLPHGPDSTDIFWRLKRFLQGLPFPPEARNGHWLSHFDGEMKHGLLTDEFRDAVQDKDSMAFLFERFREAVAGDFLDKSLYADVMMYLADDLLVKMDVASMSNSLEVRSPFLDHKFMEFAAKIPSNLKMKGLRSKYILKRSLGRLLPAQILGRKKMGFIVPLARWFREELREMLYDVILDRRAMNRGYFRRKEVRRMIDEHVSGKWNWHYHIWNLLMLELWHQMFIDRDGNLDAQVATSPQDKFF
jgi:asparagine synthase (glutamine-hydrolysing)